MVFARPAEPAASRDGGTGPAASDGLDETAVNGEIGAGDVGCAGAGEVHDEVGDLVRAGESAGPSDPLGLQPLHDRVGDFFPTAVDRE